MKCVRVHRAQRSLFARLSNYQRYRRAVTVAMLGSLAACVSPSGYAKAWELMSFAHRVANEALVARRHSPLPVPTMNGAQPLKDRTLTGGPPQIDTSTLQWKNINMALCLLPGCGEPTYSYTTPAYVSMDTPRSVTLMWNGALAGPRHTVTLDVRDSNTTKTATVISIKVRDSLNNLLDQSRGSAGQKEMFFTNRQGSWRRIAIWFYYPIWSLPTGAYRLSAIVTSYYSDGTKDSTIVPLKWLHVNERDNPMGGGWTIGGLQRLHLQADSALVFTDGTGTAQFYGYPCTGTPCTYQTPLAEFSVVSRHAARGDGTLYDRIDPYGNIVAFDSAGYEKLSCSSFGGR